MSFSRSISSNKKTLTGILSRSPLSSSDLEDTKSKRAVLVMGGTGLVGGAVVRGLLTYPWFRVLVATRRPWCAEAILLKQAGAKVVEVDYNYKHSLVVAMQNVKCVFLHTVYWENYSCTMEIVHGQNAVEAAVEAGVEHVIFDGTDYIKPARGRVCNFMRSKLEIEEILKKSGLAYTIVVLPFYFENLLTVFRPFEIHPGVYGMVLPLENRLISCAALHDMALCICKIIQQGKTHYYEKLTLSAEIMSVLQMTMHLNDHLKGVHFIDPEFTIEDYMEFEFLGAKDLAAMFQFYQLCEEVPDFSMTRALNPNTRSMINWIEDNKEQLYAMLDEIRPMSEDGQYRVPAHIQSLRRKSYSEQAKESLVMPVRYPSSRRKSLTISVNLSNNSDDSINDKMPLESVSCSKDLYSLQMPGSSRAERLQSFLQRDFSLVIKRRHSENSSSKTDPAETQNKPHEVKLSQFNWENTYPILQTTLYGGSDSKFSNKNSIKTISDKCPAHGEGVSESKVVENVDADIENCHIAISSYEQKFYADQTKSAEDMANLNKGECVKKTSVKSAEFIRGLFHSKYLFNLKASLFLRGGFHGYLGKNNVEPDSPNLSRNETPHLTEKNCCSSMFLPGDAVEETIQRLEDSKALSNEKGKDVILTKWCEQTIPSKRRHFVQPNVHSSVNYNNTVRPSDLTSVSEIDLSLKQHSDLIDYTDIGASHQGTQKLTGELEPCLCESHPDDSGEGPILSRGRTVDKPCPIGRNRKKSRDTVKSAEFIRGLFYSKYLFNSKASLFPREGFHGYLEKNSVEPDSPKLSRNETPHLTERNCCSSMFLPGDEVEETIQSLEDSKTLSKEKVKDVILTKWCEQTIPSKRRHFVQPNVHASVNYNNTDRRSGLTSVSEIDFSLNQHSDMLDYTDIGASQQGAHKLTGELEPCLSESHPDDSGEGPILSRGRTADKPCPIGQNRKKESRHEL